MNTETNRKKAGFLAMLAGGAFVIAGLWVVPGQASAGRTIPVTERCDNGIQPLDGEGCGGDGGNQCGDEEDASLTDQGGDGNCDTSTTDDQGGDECDNEGDASLTDQGEGGKKCDTSTTDGGNDDECDNEGDASLTDQGEDGNCDTSTTDDQGGDECDNEGDAFGLSHDNEGGDCDTSTTDDQGGDECDNEGDASLTDDGEEGEGGNEVGNCDTSTTDDGGEEDEDEADVSIAGICREVNVAGDTVKEWFDITNNGSDDDDDEESIVVEWADGSIEIASGETVTVSTAGPGIELTQSDDDDDETLGSADTNSEICHRSVDFTKIVEGQTLVDSYTIEISAWEDGEWKHVDSFSIAKDETKTRELPSTYDGPGIEYKIEETDDGGASLHNVDPSGFTLDGIDTEHVTVEITNSFASIELHKSASLAEVAPGDNLSYDLYAHNGGGVTLTNVQIADVLPSDVTYVGFDVNPALAAECTLDVDTVYCTFADDLAPGADSATVTINVVVSDSLTEDIDLNNQAKVLGFFDGDSEIDSDMSCETPVEGAVCDLSELVLTAVNASTTTSGDQGSEAGVTTTTAGSGSLPTTGSDSTSLLLTIGALLMGLGVVVLAAGRRTANS